MKKLLLTLVLAAFVAVGCSNKTPPGSGDVKEKPATQGSSPPAPPPPPPPPPVGG
jgi:PBP1b-binding outer membrane lipoprotein LpoB